MSLALHPVVGTIQVTPDSLVCDHDECDDSTLELLLTSFAHRQRLDNDDQEISDAIRVVALRRLTWLSAADRPVTVRANLAQLMDELQGEIEQIRRITCEQ